MVASRARALQALIGAALATAIPAAAPMASAGPGQPPLAPCYNGVTPLNPYVDNCGIPRPPRVNGSAPDQTAILNCNAAGNRALRAVCLSQYVNGGPGYFP